MPTLRLNSLLSLVAFIPLALAHGSLQSVTVGGKDYPAWVPSRDHYTAINFANGAGASAPDGQYSRKNDALDNGYIIDPTGPAIATGGVSEGALYDATSPVKLIPMNGGDAVTWNMGTWPEGHSGPILIHMASCPSSSCTGVDATTLSWFAIHHDGYSPSTSTWPTDVLARSPGAKYTSSIPTDLPSGAYLLRFELIAMHSVPAQFYPWTVEVDLTSTGTTLPSGEYVGKFPEMYTAEGNNMALDFSLYTGNDLLSFVLPGVPVYPGGTSEGNDPLPEGSGAARPEPVAPEIEEEVPVAGGTNTTIPSSSNPPSSTETPTSLAVGSSIAPTSISSVATDSASDSLATPTESPAVPTPTDNISSAQVTPIDTASPSSSQTSATLPTGSMIDLTSVLVPTVSVSDSAASGSASGSASVSAASASASVSTDQAPSPDNNRPTAGPSSVQPTTTSTASSPVLPSETSTPNDDAPITPGSPDEIQEVKMNDRTMWLWNGQYFNYKTDAAYHRCDKIRNDCLDAANALPNDKVQLARQKCETEGPACYSSIKLTRRRRSMAPVVRVE